MATQSKQTRQYLGCGWEMPIPGATPWSPQNLKADWKGEAETCPGYTTKLPEVIEIARARVHAKEFGGLRDFCDENPTENLRCGVEILEGVSNECQGWTYENPEKK